jgi:hypothetical protein
VFDKLVEWLSSPHTLVKLVRVWALLGSFLLIVMLIEKEYLNSLILSTMLLVYLILSMFVEKVVGKKNEDSTDNS